jgi:hypothetical protein
MPKYLAAADQLLAPPGIDHLGADLQVIGDLGDWSSGGHQVQDFPELGRVTLRRSILWELLDD